MAVALAPMLTEADRSCSESEVTKIPLKILVADDETMNRMLLSAILSKDGHSVVEAGNGEEAVDVFVREQPDIVLMDVMMPEMDGYETMQAIREMPRFRHLPILAVTAKAMKGDREKCIEAGAWDYLSKPVDAEQLLTVFRTWLHR